MPHAEREDYFLASLKGQAKKRVALAGQARAALSEAPARRKAGTAKASTAQRLGRNGQSHANGHVNGHANGRATLPLNAEVARKSTKTVVQVGKRGVSISRPVQQDQQLVLRCISGDPAAWSQMYDRFHSSLLTSIRAFLGRAGQDMHLVDEISARVWYSLVRNQFELLSRFDPTRGCRLSTFLSVLGKSEARLLLRSERRRKTRECVASRREVEQTDVECETVLGDSEFLATLSPRERSYYLEILVAANPNENEATYTRHNQWQLRHRVRKKLEQYLE